MSDFLLLENGSYLLQEDGSKIVIVFSIPPPTPPAIPTAKLSASWFAIPEMRKDLLPKKEKIYLNELVKQLR